MKSITDKKYSEILGRPLATASILFIVPLFNCLLFDSLPNSENFLTLIEVEVTILYALAFIISIKNRGLYSLETMFVFTLGFFSLFAIIFSFFGEETYRDTIINVIMFHWETKTAIVVINYYILFLTVFIAAISNKRRNSPIYINHNLHMMHSHNANAIIYKYAKAAFYMSFPFAIGYSAYSAIYFLSIGRTSMYIGSSHLPGAIGSALLAMNYVFNISYYFICATEDDGDRFDRISILFLLNSSISFLQGDRAGAVCAILFFIYYRYRVFNKKTSIYKLLFFGSALVVILAIIGVVRQGESFDYLHLLKEIKNFFIVSAGSLNRAAYYYQNRASMSYNTYPYILDPIVRIFLVVRYPAIFAGGNSLEMLKHRMSFAHHITYAVYQNNYLNGGGLGGNFIAEMAEFGFVGVLFFSIIYMYIFEKYSESAINSRFLKYLSPIFVQFLLMSPRSSAFFDTYTFVKYAIVYIVVTVFFEKIVAQRQL